VQLLLAAAAVKIRLPRERWNGMATQDVGHGLVVTQSRLFGSVAVALLHKATD